MWSGEVPQQPPTILTMPVSPAFDFVGQHVGVSS
jgi:hypothetical protein